MQKLKYSIHLCTKTVVCCKKDRGCICSELMAKNHERKLKYSYTIRYTMNVNVNNAFLCKLLKSTVAANPISYLKLLCTTAKTEKKLK